MQREGVTVYFHGVPGSSGELALFGAPAPVGWHAPDRGSRPAASFEAECDSLAADVRALAVAGPVRLAGFSLGGFVALHVARRLPDVSLTIELVSAAAPLQVGDFLSSMAGAPVFSTATRSSLLFRGLAGVQSLAARAAPARLAKALFASAQGEDRALADDPAFIAAVAGVLRTGLGHGRSGYVREIAAFVRDWSAILPGIRHPVSLWHGTADNWSPPGMAEALAARLPNVVAHHRLPGLSHYSTLRAWLEQDR